MARLRLDTSATSMPARGNAPGTQQSLKLALKARLKPRFRLRMLMWLFVKMT